MVNRILYPALWKAYACYLNPLSLHCCDPRKPEARTKKALDLKIKTNKQKQTLLTTTAKKKKNTLKLLCFPAKFTKSHWSSLWTSFPNFSLSKAFPVSCLWRFKKILESILVSLYKKRVLESQNNIPVCFSLLSLDFPTSPLQASLLTWCLIKAIPQISAN